MSKSALGKIREGISELADTAKEKVSDGIETVIESGSDVAAKAKEKIDLEKIIRDGQERVRQGAAKAEEITETGKGIMGRFKKAFKAFSE